MSSVKRGESWPGSYLSRQKLSDRVKSQTLDHVLVMVDSLDEGWKDEA